jgi:hypothetical protein
LDPSLSFKFSTDYTPSKFALAASFL